MRERPILFQGDMVRAILAGTKTQTRRMFREQPPAGVNVAWVPGQSTSPYGVPGDRLWVRETWAFHLHALGAKSDADGPWVYAADRHALQHRLCDRWRPSIHMPRAASRLSLEITGVRVERLQAISEADAIAEGSPCVDEVTGREVLFPHASKCGTYRLGYRALWERINGADSWAANPWVWVVEFRRAAA